jgi:hypothetical protein
MGRDAHKAAPGRRKMGQGIGMRVAIGYDFLALRVGRRTGKMESGVEQGSLFGQI